MKSKFVISLLVFFIVLVFTSMILTFAKKDVSVKEKVALIRVEGPIIQSKGIIEEIKEYTKDKHIKAIVIRVDSPGGGVVPAQEIYSEVKRASSIKKVVVSMGSLAASGGYYISAPATQIVANPGTITGSIGVIMEIPNLQGLMDKIGVKTEVIKSGRYKDMTSVFRSMGKEQREILQGVLDNVHEQFINAVAEGRKLPIEKVREFADGTVFTGSQALKKGLVDQLGTLEDAIRLAGKLAGIQGDPEVVTKKPKHFLVEMLENKIFGSNTLGYQTYNLNYMMFIQ
ncbi:MAG: signal peptide peptidase SppA [Thermodesulfovibrionales bacterium]|nr:signal peptide peptidase SppA [Thermodesulfovibrionales bacterium]